MKIWVDADACPVVIKEILYRAAERTGTELTLVANQALSTPSSANINTLQVPRGEMHTRENIGARLNMRDFLDTTGSHGVEMSGGPAAFSQRDKQTFANELDRFLTKSARG